MALQIASFAVWQGVNAWGNTKSIDASTTNSAVVIEHESAKDIKIANSTDQSVDSNIISNVRFVAKSENEQLKPLNSAKKDEIMSVIKKLPANHLATLKNLVLDYNSTAHRGLGGKELIILRAVNIGKEEFFAVMIHEIGHNVDLGYLGEANQNEKSNFTDNGKPVYKTDPSLNFYKISWDDDQTRKKDAGNLDFVSGYAVTDPFEDFAESYIYYVLHNKDFKSKTQTSAKLLQKYNFMKNKVFNGKEFDTGNYLSDKLNNRPWDITLLSYNLNSFLAI